MKGRAARSLAIGLRQWNRDPPDFFFPNCLEVYLSFYSCAPMEEDSPKLSAL